MPFKLKSLDGSVTPFRDSEYLQFYFILSQEAFYKNVVQS